MPACSGHLWIGRLAHEALSPPIRNEEHQHVVGRGLMVALTRTYCPARSAASAMSSSVFPRWRLADRLSCYPSWLRRIWWRG